MAQFEHLSLQRIERELPRKKKPGFGSSPSRDYNQHGDNLKTQIDSTIQRFQAHGQPDGINPKLILRIQLDKKATIDEATLEKNGFTLLSVDENKTLVLFPSDAEMADFRRRLDEYIGGPPTQKQKSAPHTALFAAIDEIGEIRPEDRIGRLLRFQGKNSLEDFEEDKTFTLDVELWHLGTRPLCEATLEEITQFISDHSGRVTDKYIGESLVLFRVTCSGNVVRELLQIDSIAMVDLPPSPTLTIGKMMDVGLDDLGDIPEPDDDAPGIAILDSGMTSAHPLLAPAVGEATAIPNALGDGTDGNGHGTMVSGLALYGDVQACIQNRSFVPTLRLFSARVLNDQLVFDNEKLITSQMQDAITYFKDTYNCRVFNLSLGDDRQPYDGGKVSPWASILDTLARDLDIVIVVSVGNYRHYLQDGVLVDSLLTDYPKYLLSENAKVIEPATGAIVLTVGALAESADIPPGTASESVSFRAIAQPKEPSPFTRSGPGIGGGIKPELCDFGGNFAFDGSFQPNQANNAVRTSLRSCSIVSFNHEYLKRLFTTDNGTSFAAPRVAHLAAKIFGVYPDASANLVRALLASSASIPEEAERCLSSCEKNAALMVCGYGLPDFDHAQGSDRNRVVLYAETSIDHDNFHVYEVPIPSEFLNTKGERSISVSLAFDPPVRHSRFDYLGVNMSFRLIRGQNVDEVVEVFRKRTKDEDPVDNLVQSSNCKMVPGPNLREGGTLQRADFIMKRNPMYDYGDTYFLVVRCERKWARDEHGPQHYAVVVTIKHTEAINIYSRIQQRIQARVRARG
jgi:hypothetical protein